MTFFEKLKKSKEKLKSSSVETYLRNIKRLRKVHHTLPIPPAEHKWLVEAKLFSWYDKQPLNIRRHMSTAATVALQVYKKENAEWKKRQKKSMRESDESK